MTFVVVSYDISDDRRRAKVSKALVSFGRRVQWSVFDCLLDERSLVRMRRKLATLIDHEADSVRIYRLCRRCRGSIEVIGLGSVEVEERVHVV
jgi:CRISPR-associated protein Cas2